MIITSAKDRNELLGLLAGYHVIFIVGCGSCATVCQTGGEPEVEDFALFLRNNGKEVSGSVIPDETCHNLLVKKELNKHKEQMVQSSAIVVLSCGAGVQAVASLYDDKPVFSMLDTLFLGNVQRFGKFSENCSMCGQCILNKTAGICPLTRCAKGLLNGPCGGSSNEKCEVYPENDCVWVLIYKRLKKLQMLDNLMEIQEPKDHSLRKKPFQFEIKKDS